MREVFNRKKREQKEAIRQAAVKVARSEKGTNLAMAITAPTDKDAQQAIREYSIASKLLEKLSRRR